MNPGVVEEVGETARGFIDSMKTQPLALALAVTNLLMIGLVFYIAQGVATTRRQEFAAIMENHANISKLLYSCVPATRLQSDESHPVELPPLPRARPQEAE